METLNIFKAFVFMLEVKLSVPGLDHTMNWSHSVWAATVHVYWEGKGQMKDWVQGQRTEKSLGEHSQ